MNASSLNRRSAAAVVGALAVAGCVAEIGGPMHDVGGNAGSSSTVAGGGPSVGGASGGTSSSGAPGSGGTILGTGGVTGTFGAGAGGLAGGAGGFATGGSLGGDGGTSGSGGGDATGGSNASGGTAGNSGSGGTDGTGGMAAGGSSSGGTSGGTAGSAGVGGMSGASGSAGAAGKGGSGGAGGMGGSGGASGSGGKGGSGGSGGGGGGPLSEQYPCNGSTSGYDATVIKNGSTWTAQRVGGSVVYTGTNTEMAIEAGLNSLTSGRTTKQKVLVQGDGDVAATSRIDLPNYVILNVCGTLNATGTGSGDNALLYARDRHDIDIPNVRVTGTPAYGIFFRNVNNLYIGRAEMRNTTGIGIRIDNHPSNGTYPKATNIRIDYAHVEGIQNQGVETYGVNGLVVGTVYSRNVRDSALLLNNTINAEIGTVDAEAPNGSTGYAAFRMANRNGRLDNGTYGTNIHVGLVRARGGSRGIFCVSESGGAEIERVDIVGVGQDPAIFIEDCYNVTIATESGVVNRGSATHQHRVRISARPSEFLGYSDQITIENLTLTNSPIHETECAGNNIVRNNDLINSSLTLCPGTDQGGN